MLASNATRLKEEFFVFNHRSILEDSLCSKPGDNTGERIFVLLFFVYLFIFEAFGTLAKLGKICVKFADFSFFQICPANESHAFFCSVKVNQYHFTGRGTQDLSLGSPEARMQLKI